MSTALDSRYGRQKQRKPLSTRFWVAVAALAAVLAIAFVWWATSSESAAAPEFKDIGHEIISDDEVSLTFQVVKDPEVTAVCAVKALDSNRAPVGWKEVTLEGSESSDSRVTQLTENIKVLGPATAVTVDSCWSTE